MSARIELGGLCFGRWAVLSYAGSLRWNCRCDCGVEREVAGSSLRRGLSTQCDDCHNRQMASGLRTTHGGKRTRLYNIWCKIIERCARPSCPAFSRYGGRGISICEEWRSDFAAFRTWSLDNGYSDNLTIDRYPNNDGNYEPGNCRWATKAQQNRNYSRVHFVELDGIRMPLIEAAERVGFKPYTVRQRIFRMGWSPLRALTTPVNGKAPAYTFTVEHGNIDELARAS